MTIKSKLKVIMKMYAQSDLRSSFPIIPVNVNKLTARRKKESAFHKRTTKAERKRKRNSAIKWCSGIAKERHKIANSFVKYPNRV